MPALTADASRNGTTATVVLRGVGKSYTRGNLASRVVDGVDLTVKRGECVFLMGPSGSGKTTLLSIIGCVLSADEGDVRILGQDVGQLQGEQAVELRRNGIGFVFQRFHLIRGLTARENVAVPLTLAGWKPSAAMRRADEMLALVDLSAKANVQPQKLSVGQCQRVAFARALAADPPLILADEPTASLDAATGQRALELLRRLTVDAGKSVIVVTHDQRILPFADRTLQMENGKVVEQRREAASQSSVIAQHALEPLAAL